MEILQFVLFYFGIGILITLQLQIIQKRRFDLFIRLMSPILWPFVLIIYILLGTDEEDGK